MSLYLSILFFSFAQASDGSTPSLAGLSNIFNWAIGIGAILALGKVVYSGIMYTISAGNESKQKEEINGIKGAALGFGFLLGAYILLQTIDPRVLSPSVQIPDLQALQPMGAPRVAPSINDPGGLLQTQVQKDEVAKAISSIHGATHAETLKDEMTGKSILKVYDSFGNYHVFDIGEGWR